MHELQLVKNMVDILDKEVQDPEVGKVKAIHLEVGKLKYIVPEIFVTCFDGTPKAEKLEDANINIDVLPIIVRCKTCGAKTEADEKELKCSKCQETDVDLISGNEFKIKGIEW